MWVKLMRENHTSMEQVIMLAVAIYYCLHVSYVHKIPLGPLRIVDHRAYFQLFVIDPRVRYRQLLA